MKIVSLLRVTSGLAVTGLVAYKLATIPISGTDAAPISAGVASGFPWKPEPIATSAQQMIPASSEQTDAELIERAFASHSISLLGARVLDLRARGADTTINVQVSAGAIDSTVLHPNEVFSFNSVVGIRTIERGYQAGLMYSNGQLITGVGGGICVTSTVLYNVALETGMKIIERHPHSGPVAYAEPGRDSAVAYGSLDLQFKNTTGSIMLIRSIIEDDKLIIAFYGKKQPGRDVEIITDGYEPIPYEMVEKEDPAVPEGESKVDQKGQPGYSVTTMRVTRQDGRVISRELISRDMIRPKNEIVLIHPKPKDASTTSEQNQGFLPVPMYTPKQDMPQVPLALPDPATQDKNKDANTLPIPDAGTGSKTGSETEATP